MLSHFRIEGHWEGSLICLWHGPHIFSIANIPFLETFGVGQFVLGERFCEEEGIICIVEIKVFVVHRIATGVNTIIFPISTHRQTLVQFYLVASGANEMCSNIISIGCIKAVSDDGKVV